MFAKFNSKTFSRELMAGITTFLTVAYIIFVNPTILGQAGMDPGAVFVATCVVAAFGSVLMGLFSDTPIVVAPGLPLATFFTYVIVKNMGLSWQQGLGAVFISGIIFWLLSMSKIRKIVLRSIPHSLSIGIACGIGYFIAFVGLQSAGVVIANKSTLIQLGQINTWPAVLFFIGFLIISVLDYYEVMGAILIGILTITALSLMLGLNHFQGVFAMPPSLKPTLLQLHFQGLATHEGIMAIFALVLIAYFDSVGTMIGLLRQMQVTETKEVEKRIGGALVADSVGTIAGSLAGTSGLCTFIESAAGIRAGGRTGIVAYVVALGFILALFLSPLAKIVPGYATASALFYVAILILRHIVEIDWQDFTEAIPCMVTFIMIPLSFSIADGFGLGVIAYVVLKLFTGKFEKLNLALLILAIIFVVYFVFRV